jgi:hypothetical protein
MLGIVVQLIRAGVNSHQLGCICSCVDLIEMPSTSTCYWSACVSEKILSEGMQYILLARRTHTRPGTQRTARVSINPKS